LRFHTKYVNIAISISAILKIAFLKVAEIINSQLCYFEKCLIPIIWDLLQQSVYDKHFEVVHSSRLQYINLNVSGDDVRSFHLPHRFPWSAASRFEAKTFCLSAKDGYPLFRLEERRKGFVGYIFASKIAIWFKNADYFFKNVLPNGP
jgi:hypothetical protein